eukprot:13714769-Ditylum_brightwellii.AAC.1
MIDYVYLIVQCTGKFNSSLTAWNARPRADHMWVNCQSHFRDTQKALRKTGALTVQEGMNQEEIVNMIAEGIQHAINLKEEKTQHKEV